MKGVKGRARSVCSLQLSNVGTAFTWKINRSPIGSTQNDDVSFQPCNHVDGTPLASSVGYWVKMFTPADQLIGRVVAVHPCKGGATVTPERLPPVNIHSLWTYYQVMEWMGCSDEIDPFEWGWKVEEDKLVPVMTDKSPAPAAPIKMIHCNCSEGCNTL